MKINWLSILFVGTVLFLALLVINLIDKNKKMNSELKRKMFHVTMGLTTLLFPYIFDNIISLAILAVIAVLVLFVIKHTNLKKGIGDALYGVKRESLGEVFFCISVFLIFYLSKGDKILYSIPIIILTFADSAAALIGKKYAKESLASVNEDAKSIEGSFTFFIVAFMATLVPLLLFTTVGREETLIISVIIGANVSLVEMISHSGNDNLLIPLTTFAFLSTHINMSIVSLRQNLIILVVIFVLVTIANKIKVWSKLALVETLVIGYLTIILYGVYAVFPPLMLFLTALRFPKIRENEKSNLYDINMIGINAVIGTAICGIVALLDIRSDFFIVYLLAYSLHLAINSFIRFKYYFYMSQSSSLIFAFAKALGFIFLPGLILQKIFLGGVPSISACLVGIALLLLGTLIILIEKMNVEKEEFSVKNGYLQLRIVLLMVSMLGVIQYFKVF